MLLVAYGFCSLFVACCLLRVGCSLLLSLRVACCVLFVFDIDCFLFGVSCSLFGVCALLRCDSCLLLVNW